MNWADVLVGSDGLLGPTVWVDPVPTKQLPQPLDLAVELVVFLDDRGQVDESGLSNNQIQMRWSWSTVPLPVYSTEIARFPVWAGWFLPASRLADSVKATTTIAIRARATTVRRIPSLP